MDLSNEEAFAQVFQREKRRREGIYFTPEPLVAHLLERAGRLVPDGRPLAIVDPACGAGAFLRPLVERYPQARCFGLDLSSQNVRTCRARAPGATVLRADALRGGIAALSARIPAGSFELWIGNPPYNGTSSLLSEPERLRAYRAALGALPRGTSLRDDFVFFLMEAAARLASRPGALCFITPATLLDAYLYAPLRRWLLERLELVEVIELGAGVFADTKVHTCATLWRSGRGTATSFRYVSRRASGPFDSAQLEAPRWWTPGAPDWLLRPVSTTALSLDAEWSGRGEPLATLVPVSFPGLKTRFDELLVDDDRDRLLERVDDFLRCAPEQLEVFGARWGMSARLVPKLQALKAFASQARLDPSNARRFFRYAGARHRGVIPPEARAWCYLDRRLIPRGDHRLRGAYDPHGCEVKLVFNTRERPLCAALVEEPGCVHDHRHARFAPLYVPRVVYERGLGAVPAGALDEWVPNLSERGRAWAERLGSPRAVFRAISDFVNSPDVQERWAPVFAASRTLPVPIG